ncbi:MAG: hypothetical protein J0I32_18005 [Sphingobacteriales bacterium]|nr:hypothetical protein [Sphingobacteriales bacterium]OJV97425.1 MAG: hypothetical protein BGO52_09035 [Sphingobacteriales bacterium 44-61]
MKLIFTLFSIFAFFCSAYSQNWLTSGNSGTTSSNFIGTTDNQPLLFRTNNIQRFHITNDGKTVVGAGLPGYDAILTIRSNSGALGGSKLVLDGANAISNPGLIISTTNTNHYYPSITFESANWGATVINQYEGLWHSVPVGKRYSWIIGTVRAMRLTTNGNLLIGTETENTARLKLSGSGGMLAEFTDAGTTAGYIRIRNSGTDYTDMGLEGSGLVSLKSNGTAFLYGNSAGSVNVGSSTIDASAKLSVTSTTQGFLPPRMTTTQKNAISSPAAGLMVYDNTLGKYNYYNGSGWQELGAGASQWTNSGTNISYATGNVGIGTNAIAEHKLAVNGSIIAEKMKVKLYGNWPDYVFEKGHKIPSLEEVEAFIHKHKHLPDVPSAATVESEGLDLGNNQAALLKKIEELTLYMIEQNKRIEAQEKKISYLEAQLKK